MRPFSPCAFDARYSNVGNQQACPRGLLPSRRASDPEILVECCRSIAPRTDGTTSSTTPHGESSERHFRVIHPFHPLFGQEFELVDRRTNWGENRVYFFDARGQVQSISASFTDVAGVDVFVDVAAGRSYFRFDDLIQLAALLERLR